MTRWVLAGMLLALGSATARADDDPPPSYSKDVKPFLTRYCMDCHSGPRSKSGVQLDSYQAMMEKSRKKAIVPGKPDDSLLVKTLDGNAKPMPPKRYVKHPTDKEIKMVRDWITAGATDDTTDDKGTNSGDGTKKGEEKKPEEAKKGDGKKDG